MSGDGQLTDIIFSWPTLSTLADFISILSFIATCFVFIGLREIKKKYLFQATIEKNLKNIKNQSSKLSMLLNDFSKNKDEVVVVIQMIDAELEVLKDKISTKSTKKRVSGARYYIRKRLKILRENDVRHFYAGLNGLIQNIEGIVSDSRSGV